MNKKTALPDFDMSVRDFTALLSFFGVSTRRWGIGPARTVRDLMKLIRRGELFLSISGTGLTLHAGASRALITNREGKILVVKRKILHRRNNLSLPRGNLPGGKIAVGEEPIFTLKRELEEELGLKPGQYKIGKPFFKGGPKKTPSFPTLICKRELHIFPVVLKPNAPFPLSGTFRREPKDECLTLVFCWRRNWKI